MTRQSHAVRHRCISFRKNKISLKDPRIRRSIKLDARYILKFKLDARAARGDPLHTLWRPAGNGLSRTVANCRVATLVTVRSSQLKLKKKTAEPLKRADPHIELPSS